MEYLRSYKDIIIEGLLPGGGLAEHIWAIGHTGAQSVREEDAERSVRGKYFANLLLNRYAVSLPVPVLF